jgi:hypothetical protein
MVVFYSAASLFGALVTALLIGQHNLMLGLMAAPFGGSLSAAAAAALILFRRSSPPLKRKTVPPAVVWC